VSPIKKKAPEKKAPESPIKNSNDKHEEKEKDKRRSSEKDKHQEKEKVRVKKHSSEIVVSKAKLADNERKMNEAAMRDILEMEEKSKASKASTKASKASTKVSSSSHFSPVSRSTKASVSEKKESTFEKLRRERDEKRLDDLAVKKDALYDSDVEIISGTNSDDVSEMTDPTYATKKEEKRKSRAHDLEPVEEVSSPEKSPRKSKISTNRSKESEDDSRSGSRSKSPQSKSTSRSREKSSKVSKGSEDDSRSRSRSKSPQSKSTSRSREKSSKVSKGSEGSEDDSRSGSNSKSPQSKSTSRSKEKPSKVSPEKGDDGWNPESFKGKENFIATMDPFKAASSSSDPFDEPFYPTANDDAPKQMFSFVYSESDGEMDRVGYSKDTITDLSFDEENSEDENNYDGLSFATPAAQSDTTEVVQNNSVANSLRKMKQMLPPSQIPVAIENNSNPRSRPRGQSPVRDAFLGIDESGAVTLNVSPKATAPQKKKEPEKLKMQMGSLSQRALNHSKKRGFLDDDDDDEPGKIEIARASLYPKTTTRERRTPSKSPERDIYSTEGLSQFPERSNLYRSTERSTSPARSPERSNSRSRSPERRMVNSPSFILDRREKRKAREAELVKKTKVTPRQQFSVSRGKSDISTAIERGRRRENIFEHSSKTKPGGRTYSPDKLRFALTVERAGSPTKALARATPRSPQPKARSAMRTGSQKQDSWIERPQYDTRSNRKIFSKEPSTRTAFKAPAVFSGSTAGTRFKAPEHYSRRTDPVLKSVAHIEDPIQRAGAMILSAAAIPIQTEMRRYLSVKHREDRAWAIIVVQAYFRRWKAELTRYKHLYCATRIQAVFRGWLIRDTMEDKHHCATQIQKIARGYLATMSVYEDLYNITVVQSIARRNNAIKAAEDRYLRIIVIQSLWRGRQCRRELNYLHWNATKVQTAWRGYTAQLSYQFDIVDIIIVQSIARKKAGMNLYKKMREAKLEHAAITIQKCWRSYDCTMNYLHAVADVLIIQSVVRRWIATSFVQKYREDLHYKMAIRIQMCVRSWLSKTRVKKQRGARDIQKTWRGFWCYTDYVFTLADIIMAQKTVRAYQARKRVSAMAAARDEKEQYESAVAIQKIWRGYSAQMEMLFSLVHIIVVQVSCLCYIFDF